MSQPTQPSEIDHRICEQARLTRDARFDGLFFTAVTSTGIYCRPVCPAPAPKAQNVRYYDSAAAAAAAGFRPCLRCRPEAAPGSALHRAKSDLVAGALRLIDEGVLDEGSLPELAARVGVGERHLRRVFAEELGASPLDVAATRRLLFAKQLLAETALPMTAIAHASGYASLRRFNAAFSAAWGKPPRALRRESDRATGELRRSARANSESGSSNPGDIVLRLPYRAPFDFAHLLQFFSFRALDGVESVEGSAYRRSFVIDSIPGWIEVAQIDGEDALGLRVNHPQIRVLASVVARVKRMFDLDADPRAIASILARDPLLRGPMRRWPGQRLAGAWDAFELGVRAILGQQISVARARTLAVRVVAAYGTPFAEGRAVGLTTLFPEARSLADAPLEELGVMRSRAESIRNFARAIVDGRIRFGAEQPLAAIVNDLVALPGIGAWTAHYIALRALAQPDAFPAADLVLRNVAGADCALSTRELERRSDAWRPWRAYAAMLLWRSAS